MAIIIKEKEQVLGEPVTAPAAPRVTLSPEMGEKEGQKPEKRKWSNDSEGQPPGTTSTRKTESESVKNSGSETQEGVETQSSVNSNSGRVVVLVKAIIASITAPFSWFFSWWSSTEEKVTEAVVTKSAAGSVSVTEGNPEEKRFTAGGFNTAKGACGSVTDGSFVYIPPDDRSEFSYSSSCFGLFQGKIPGVMSALRNEVTSGGLQDKGFEIINEIHQEPQNPEGYRRLDALIRVAQKVGNDLSFGGGMREIGSDFRALMEPLQKRHEVTFKPYKPEATLTELVQYVNTPSQIAEQCSMRLH